MFALGLVMARLVVVVRTPVVVAACKRETVVSSTGQTGTWHWYWPASLACTPRTRSVHSRPPAACSTENRPSAVKVCSPLVRIR